MSTKTPQVGAQDPQLRNSPIAWEVEDEYEAPEDFASEEPTCFFNGHPYPQGTIVKSGTALLRCESGLWVPAGPGDPDNP